MKSLGPLSQGALVITTVTGAAMLLDFSIDMDWAPLMGASLIYTAGNLYCAKRQ